MLNAAIFDAIPALRDHEVHVWKVPLHDSDGNAPYGVNLELLSEVERQKAARFVFTKDREVYAHSHSILRQLLAYYGNGDAKSLHFHQNAFGKPHLPITDNPANIRFNLSHSGDQALIAITRQIELGVDIEYMRKDRQLFQLSQRFFSPAECQALGELAADDLRHGFYRLWTRKEAFIKAVGNGLHFPLNKFSVSLARDQASLLWADASLFSGPCCLYPLAVDADFNASLACLCDFVSIHYFSWPPAFINSSQS